MSRISILGAGAWGTAIALALDRRGGHQLSLWAHTHELAQEINDAGENHQFLPGFPLPKSITVTADCEVVTFAKLRSWSPWCRRSFCARHFCGCAATSATASFWSAPPRALKMPATCA